MSIVELNNKVILLKTKLQDSDYQALKYAEGEITEGEYATIRAQRRAWRAEINALETQIAALRG